MQTRIRWTISGKSTPVACGGLLVLLAIALLFPARAHAAMTIDSGPRISITPYQTTVWWYSSSSGSSELRWDTDPVPWADMDHDVSNTATNLGTLHSRTIENLGPGTYHYRVRTTGAAGTVTTGLWSFTIEEQDAATPLGALVVEGEVLDHALSPDGATWYVGGNFTRAGPRTGAGAMVDASGQRLPGVPQVAGTIEATVSDGTGGVYVGGTFNRVGGLPLSNLVHILPDGGVDPTFPGADGTVRTLVRSGTTLYVGGQFSSIGSVARSRLAAINVTNTEVLPFATTPNQQVTDIAVGGGSVYVAGHFTSVGGQPRQYVASLDATTGALQPLSLAPNSLVNAIAADGTTLYVGGYFTNIAGSSRTALAAIDTTVGAGVATSFDANANGIVQALTYAASTLYVGGGFTNIGGQARTSVAALDTTTGLATSFVANAVNTVAGTTIEELTLDGSTLAISGTFETVGGQPRTHVAFVDTTSNVVLPTDVGLGLGSYTRVNSTSFVGAHRFVGGYLSTMNATGRNRLAAIDTATMTLTPFDPGANGVVQAVELDGTRLFVAGDFTTIAGQPRARIASFDTTTGTIEAFAPGASSTVSRLAVSAGTVYASGTFTGLGGQARARIGAVDAVTGVATAFDPNPSTFVDLLAVDGADVYVGLTTGTVGGQARTGIAALDATSGLATAFNPAADNRVTTALVDGGRLLVGGSFTSIGGQSRNGLASLDPLTGAADTFNPNLVGTPYSIVRSGSDLVIGGYFFSVAGLPRTNVALVDATTGSLRPRRYDLVNRAGTAFTSLLVHGSRIYAAGRFERNQAGTDQSGIAVFETGSSRTDQADEAPLTITGAPQVRMAPAQVTISWTTSASSSSELVYDRSIRGSWSEYQFDASNRATNLGTKHSRTIANLPAGVYRFRVRSRTAAGKQVTSTEQFFNIESPNAVTPLNASVINGRVEAQAVSDDGDTLYVGGSFSRVGTRSGGGMSVSSAGTGSLRPGTPQFSGFIHEVIPDGAGGWYVGGAFGGVGGINASHLAHILPDGGVDPDFAFTFQDGGVVGLARVGTTLYVGGDFTAVAGSPRARIAAIDLTTNTVTPFDPGADDTVHRLVASGGTLYAGGAFDTIAGAPLQRLAAIDIATGVATGFDADVVGDNVFTLALDGPTLYFGGIFTQVGGQSRSHIAAVNATSGAVTPFAPDANNAVWSIVSTGPDVYIGGDFDFIGGQVRSRIAQVDAATGSATAFDPGADDLVTHLYLQGTTLFVTGSFSTLAGQPRRNAGAVDTSTELATTFDPAPDSASFAVASDGTNTFIGGEFTSVRGAARSNLAALDARTGALLSATADTDGRVRSLLNVGPNLYVGGSFTTIDGQPRNRLAALDTSMDPTSFDPDVNGTVRGIIEHDASTIGIGGEFTQVGGTARNYLAGIDTTTGIVTGFSIGTNGPVSVAIQDGTTVYIGGEFTQVDGQPRDRIAAFDGGANTLLPFDPGADDEVLALALDGATLFVGGRFQNIGGQPRSRLAGVDAATGAVSAFDPDIDGPVRALRLSGPRLFVGGRFEHVGTQDVLNLVSVDTSTGAPTAFVHFINLSSADDLLDPSGVYSIVTMGDRVAIGGTYNVPFTTNWLSHSGTMLFDICDRATLCDGEGLRDYVTISGTSGTAALGSMDPDVSSTTTASVNIQSNAMNGYALYAVDASNTTAMDCVSASCGAATIPDWTGNDPTPSQWAPADTGPGYGLGLTVLGSTHQPRMAKWGVGTSATDFVDNRYVGLRGTSAVLLHLTNRYMGLTPDTTTFGIRARVDATQAAGDYAGSMTFIAVPNV